MRDIKKIRNNAAIMDNNRFGKIFGETFYKRKFDLTKSGELIYDASDSENNRIELKMSRQLVSLDIALNGDNILDFLEKDNINDYRKLLSENDWIKGQIQGLKIVQAFDFIYFGILLKEGLQICYTSYENLKADTKLVFSPKTKGNDESFRFDKSLWDTHIFPTYGVEKVNWTQIVETIEK